MRFLASSALQSASTARSMARARSFLLLTGGLLSSPWVAMRQCLYRAVHMQCQYDIFLNLLKVTLTSRLIYCSSGPEHRCVFHIMSSTFRSTYAMLEPHFQKCFITILGASLLDYRIRRNLSFLCPLLRTQHRIKGSAHTRLYFVLRFGLQRKETWMHSLEGPRERAGQDWSFV